jgi:hypothetical protein
MPTLYIIGNGFDLEHNLKTSYWDFRNYLMKYADGFLTELENMYSLSPNSRESALYQYLWKSFEFQLSQADDDQIFDLSSSIVSQLGLEMGLMGIEDTMDDYWENQYNFVLDMNSYIKKWVRQVRLTKAKPRKQVLISNQTDYFLTFNYTNVLERIYNIPCDQILHIHGGLTPYCQDEPVIGHGNAAKIKELRNQAKAAEAEFDEANTSIYNALADYYERTFKNTALYINVHLKFFKKLYDVDNVVIIGQSLGDVDLPYLRIVKNKVKADAIWEIYYYKPSERDELMEAVKSIRIVEDNIKLYQADIFWDIT